MSLEEQIKKLASGYFSEVKEIRHHIHSHPELSFQEKNTSAFVAEQLNKIGIPFSHMADTGIVGIIQGSGTSDKVLALRADLDALPITEKTDASYRSTVPGVMHACGHDVHTSCLLGAARILHELRDQFSGTIKLIFQPGEEMLPGGASLMIKEGVLENPAPQGIVAQHVQTELPAGKVGFRSGLYMASTDELYITVKGKGGHGAMPHQNIDPILIASHLIVALQQVVSRWTDPSLPCVLSFGKVIAEGATNVIPSEVYIEGTFRTFNEEWRKEAHERMTSLAKGLVESMGGKVDFEIRNGYPFLKNDEDLTGRMRAAAEQYMGKENVVELEIRSTAEDFAYYTQSVPACFYRLGTGNRSKGITAPVHSPYFDIDENALVTGMGLMAYLAMNELTK
jgi:amidohydrolase